MGDMDKQKPGTIQWRPNGSDDGLLRDRTHWICSLIGHDYYPHETGNWFYCGRCGRMILM